MSAPSTRHTRHTTVALALAWAALSLPAPASPTQETDDTRAVTVSLATDADGRSTPVRSSAATPTSDRRMAASLRGAASKLYDNPTRWEDVAILHVHAAVLSGLEGFEAASDLILAGNLFWNEGERRYACATLRKAGEVSLGNGDVRRADRAFRHASHLGPADCDTSFDELLAERFVPAPAAVTVEPPEIEDVNVEEARIRPVLRRPELEAPPIAVAVRIPPAPKRVHVTPPTIQLPNLEEARISPVFPRPRLPAPELPGQGQGGLR